MLLAEVLEVGMLVCFGLSWPINALKAYKAGTAKGTSWQFLALISAGYVCGIAAKFASGDVSWVVLAYVLNCLFLIANWAVYARNCRLDARRTPTAEAVPLG